ncbi:MAG: hypothetical protein HY731_00125 [Candidatus Tectomicrobia bacterium]|nr:hypothetical protein [Candidatus Tectomicrobia bacterium]
MMPKQTGHVVFLTILLLLFILNGCGSVGGGSNGGGGESSGGRPGQPIAERIVALIPNTKGRSLVRGEAGAVERFATVDVTTSNSNAITVITAAADGSFQLFVDASSGDLLRIAVRSSTGVSPITTVTVLSPADAVKTGVVITGDDPLKIVISGTTGFVVNSGSHAITNFDLDSLRALFPFIVFTNNSGPFDLAFLNETLAYVSNTATENLTLVNPRTSQITGMIQGTSLIPFRDPRGLAISYGKLYVANANILGANPTSHGLGSITVIETSTNRIIGSITTTQLNPQFLTAVGSNRVYVVNSGTLTTRSLLASTSLEASTEGGVDVIDTTTDRIIANIPLGLGGPVKLAVAPDRRRGFLPSALRGVVFVVDLVANIPINDANNPLVITSSSTSISDIKINADGLAFIGSFGSDEIFVFDTANGILNPPPFVAPFRVGSGGRNAAGVQDLALRSGTFSGPDLFVLTSLNRSISTINTRLFSPE